MAIQTAILPSTNLATPDGYFKSLECPLTLQYMKDPVIDPHGHTFERAEIMRWAKSSDNNNQQQFKCPLISEGEWISVDLLYPNRMVKDITLELQDGLESRINTIIHKGILEQSQQIKAQLEAKYDGYMTTLQKSVTDLQKVCTNLSRERDLAVQKQKAFEEKLHKSEQENHEKDKEIEKSHNTIKSQETMVKSQEITIEKQRIAFEKQRTAFEQQEKASEAQESRIKENHIEKTLYRLALVGMSAALAYFFKKK